MRLIVFIGLVLIAAVLSGRADEKLPLLKVGSEVYSNVTVIRVTATDINFLHSRGVANAKLKDLSPELQTHFHYDAVKAGEAQKQQIQANAQYQQEAAKKPVLVRREPQAEAPARPPADDQPVIPVPRLYARPFLNRPAPSLIVEKWLTPQPDLTGKFVLIDFWATWCGPCRRAIPELNALHAKFKDQIVFIGLSDETEPEVRAMKSPAIDYSVAIDTRAQMKNVIEVSGIPHAILIDPKGIVRFEGMPGYLTEGGLERLLTKYSE